MHCLFWLKDTPKYIENLPSSNKECSDFIDKFITTEPDVEEDLKPYIQYQIHDHTRTCYKKTNVCRFGYPKPPLPSTRILDPLPTGIQFLQITL